MTKAQSKKPAATAPKPAANTESGMESGPDIDAFRAKLQAKFDKADADGEPLTPRERTEAFNAEFEKAKPEVQQELIDQAQVGLEVRGY